MRGSFFATLFWLAACTILVSSDDIDDLYDLSLDELLSISITIASKSDESLADAPSSVTVFTQKEIRNLGVTSLQELLNYVPGFQSTRDVEQGRANRVSARGKTSALSESVLFLINGQRINDLYTGGISVLNRMMVVENIKQVEIIRGPGSALYGSNAFMGVVNIVTSESFQDATLTTGSNNARGASINLSQDVGNFTLSAFVKGYSDDGNTYTDIVDIFGNSTETWDPWDGMDMFMSLKNGNFKLNARHMERTVEDFLTFSALANRINNETMSQSSINASYKKEIRSNLSLDMVLGYSKDRWDTLGLLIPKDLEIAPGFALSEHFIGGPYLESDNLAGSLDLTWNNAKHLLKAGVSLERAKINSVANQFTHHPFTLDYLGDITFFDGDESFNLLESREITGLYLQDKITFSEKFSATLGVRYDSYNDFGSSLNPRGAVIYKGAAKNTFKLMYGQAFRAPNFLELYDRNNPVDFGNRDLDAEAVETIEVAWIKESKRFTSALTLFRSEIEDIISLGAPIDHPDNPFGAPSFYNVGTATTEGLEGEWKASFGKNWLLFATYTQFFNDDVAFPKSFGSATLNYSKKKWNLNLNGIWRGKNDALPEQSAYQVLNLNMRYMINERLNVSGNIRNMGDEDYLTQSDVFPGGVPNRGRDWYLSLTYQY